MARRVLDDGRWFEDTAADTWEEGTWWDGNNHRSLATGAREGHQQLYRTRGGRWILHEWSQWQGSRASYTEIDAADAARWLVRNQHEAPRALGEAVAGLEVA